MYVLFDEPGDKLRDLLNGVSMATALSKVTVIGLSLSLKTKVLASDSPFVVSALLEAMWYMGRIYAVVFG